MPKLVDQSGFWVGGIDSRDDPAYLGATNYQWSFNTLNRGGIMRTRPGFAEAVPIDAPYVNSVFSSGAPQGMAIFTPLSGISYMVLALFGQIWTAATPFTFFVQLTPIKFVTWRPVIFEIALKTTNTADDGTLTFVDQPYPVLIMQDGISRAAFWDGNISRHTDPLPINTAHETPIGQAMKWSGSRLWVGNGRHLRASNLGDPLKFTEEAVTAEGGFFSLEDEITGIGETPDLRALLVYTPTQTTTFQSNIFDRAQWGQTPDFQKVLFREIGCVSHRSIINQYGMTWWYSHNGLMSLDNALQTYRSSRINYKDQAMMRSKAHISHDMSGICAGNYENFLFYAVPSGDRWNAHTWIMDQTVLDTFEGQDTERSSWASAWKGIRPINFVTAVIAGERRCYCISRDEVPDAKAYQWRVGVWQLFTSQKIDSTYNGAIKRITCGFESRLIGFSTEPKRITHVELDLSDLVGTVNIRIFYAGRRSNYKLVGQKQIVATTGSLGGPVQETIDLNSILTSYFPQSRIIRSNEIKDGGIPKVGVQGPYIRSIDRGFSVYIEWEGEMGLRAVRLFMEAYSAEERILGVCEADEMSARYVDQDGTESITEVAPRDQFRHYEQSAFIPSFNQKLFEPSYLSRS
jgi:hypothetical protein